MDKETKAEGHHLQSHGKPGFKRRCSGPTAGSVAPHWRGGTASPPVG